MKTKEQVLQAIKEGRKSECIDGRDYSRLGDFCKVKELEILGLSLKDGVDTKKWKVEKWTKKNILKRLKSDVEFGFEKALNQRGISSGLMFEVVKMWLWVLDDELQNFKDYAMYGLPLFKAVAVKYGFENPIGEDSGSEYKYDEH